MVKKTIWILLIALCGGVFLCSLGWVVLALQEYQDSARFYEQAAKQAVRSMEADLDETADEVALTAPISVDFEVLQAVNADVIGWIYCEDTVINYPVLQGTDNSYYLRRLYDGTYNSSGSLFVDCANSLGFADANNIIYGHNMKNGSMFAGLENWSEQSYYDDHPILWLLTPEQDYAVLLFAGYTTAADSDVYTIYTTAGESLAAYLAQCYANSDFESDVIPEQIEKILTLSTCDYSFANARYVLQGMLCPVSDMAGNPSS